MVTPYNRVRVNYKIYNLLVSLVIGLAFVHVSRGQSGPNGPPCTGEEYVGVDTTDNSILTAGSETGSTYIMMGDSMQVPCCGVVTEWRFGTKNGGRLTTQVWRNTAGTNYEVVGENSIPGVGADEDRAEVIAPAEQVSVRLRDKIAWVSDGPDIVGFFPTGSSVMGRLSASGQTALNGVASWAGAPVNGEQYHFGASLGPGAAPTFTGSLPDTATAKTTDPAGTNLFTVAPTDDNASDIPDLMVTVVSNTALFEMNGLDVQTLGTLEAGRSYEVAIKVEDTCGYCATSTLTVVVTDEPPDITSLPIAASLLPEDSDMIIVQHDLTFTDDGDLTQVRCSMTSDPTPAPFTLRPAVGTSDYQIKYVPNEMYKLNFALIPLYVFNVTCYDQNGGASITREFQVSVEQNDPPLTSDPDVISVDASTTLNGTLVHTLTTTDTDDVFYNMTSSNCPFKLLPNGEIYSDDDMCAIRTTPCVITYNVSDGYNTVEDTLTINLDNVNFPPNITYPDKVYPRYLEVSVQEHTDEGIPNLVDVEIDVLDGLTVDDPDGDTIEWVMTFNNNRGKKLFNYDSATGKITSAVNLDYEKLTRDSVLNTIVDIRAWDGCEYSELRRISINVENVNEPVMFLADSYAIDTYETVWQTVVVIFRMAIPLVNGHARRFSPRSLSLVYDLISPRNVTITCGIVIMKMTTVEVETGIEGSGSLSCPLFDVWDEDVRDFFTYTITCPTTEFRMDSGSNSCKHNVVQLSEYDLDAGNMVKDTIECDVVVSDRGGLNDTTKLYITVREEDDNPPILDLESYADCVSFNNLTGPDDNSNIQATATDIDVQDKHKRLTYSLSSSEFGIRSNGQIYSKKCWENEAVPTTRKFVLTVRDEAGNFDTALVTICINVAPTTTTTTTTTTTIAPVYDNVSSLFDNPANLAWFIPLLLIGLLALGMSIFMCYRLCSSGACSKVFGGSSRIGGMRGMRGMRGGMAGRGGGTRMVVRRVPVQQPFNRMFSPPARGMKALPPPPPPPPPPPKKPPKPPKLPKPPKEPKPPKPPKLPKPPKPPKEPKPPKPPKEPKPPKPPKQEKPPKPPKQEPPPPQPTPPQQNTNSMMDYFKPPKEPQNADGHGRWNLWSLNNKGLDL